jgi:NAD(P)-dependent dehydrogenase (short-subunit alcohol dehydrogenase family)
MTGAVAERSMRFRDRVVVVTGAAGAIGRAAARRFVAEGARVALLDRSAAGLAQVSQALHAAGAPTLPVVVEIAEEDSVAAALATVESQFGRIDVMFNNAGIGGMDVPVVAMVSDDWDRMIAVNLRGVMLSCKYGVPALLRAGGGAIVNMGSSTGRHDTLPGSSAYMASKAAVEAFSRSLALQVARAGIRVNTICPGIIRTPLSIGQRADADPEAFFGRFAARIPLGRVGMPDDIAGIVAYLASDQARAITGASLLIDGGQTLRRWVSAPDM